MVNSLNVLSEERQEPVHNLIVLTLNSDMNPKKIYKTILFMRYLLPILVISACADVSEPNHDSTPSAKPYR